MTTRQEVIQHLADATHDLLYQVHPSHRLVTEAAVVALLNGLGPIGAHVAALHGLDHEHLTDSARVVGAAIVLAEVLA